MRRQTSGLTMISLSHRNRAMNAITPGSRPSTWTWGLNPSRSRPGSAIPCCSPRSSTVSSTRVATRVSHPRSTLWLLAALLPLALLLAALLWPARANSAERYTLSGHKIAVYNLAGTMVIEPASGSEAVVEAMLAGRDQGKLKIATGRIDERQTLRVLYPGNSIIYPQYGRGSTTTTRVPDDGTSGGSDSNLWPSGRRVRVSGSGWGGGVEAHADL